LKPGAATFALRITDEGLSVRAGMFTDPPVRIVKGSNELTETESIGTVALFITFTAISFSWNSLISIGFTLTIIPDGSTGFTVDTHPEKGEDTICFCDIHSTYSNCYYAIVPQRRKS
jgi:hypothetical protein